MVSLKKHKDIWEEVKFVLGGVEKKSFKNMVL